MDCYCCPAKLRLTRSPRLQLAAHCQMDEATGSLDDDASSSEGASSVDYISEVSDAESTASEAAAAALEDVIDAVERRVDRQRRRAHGRP